MNAEAGKRRPATMALHVAAIGIVFGDIGTSPLYTMRQCFDPLVGLSADRDSVLGVVSLVFWAVALVVTLKYVLFVLRADNNGEGGVLSLAALALSAIRGDKGPRMALPTAAMVALMGMLGAALFFGDGVITPAISVLGAVEGLHVISPMLDDTAMPVALAVLFLLFFFQKRGTAKVGRWFGPVMVVWFSVLSMLGIYGIFQNPGILAAVNPWYGLSLLIQGHFAPLALLGAVVLAVTGAEALYADMGHFGRDTIRRVWFALVWPALVLNYMGQGALLLEDPEAIRNPFYLLAPEMLRIPLVILATMAAVIASQAVISGAFSVASQAVEMGWLPRLNITHTSAAEAGQVYVGVVNTGLMVAVIATVLAFKSSANLAAAYGLAVTATMGLTTLLWYVVSRRIWGWARGWSVLFAVLFLVLDLSFFIANATKVFDGGWLPVSVAALLLVLMWTWIRGRGILADRRYESAMALDDFLNSEAANAAPRVKGTAIFMTADPALTPAALQQNFKHNGVLPKRAVLVSVVVENRPRVPLDKQLTVTKLGRGFMRVEIRHGFMQPVVLPVLLERCRGQGIEIDEDTSYFVSREEIVRATRAKSRMMGWQAMLFILMRAYQQGPTEFFGLPPERVIEIGLKEAV